MDVIYLLHKFHENTPKADDQIALKHYLTPVISNGIPASAAYCYNAARSVNCVSVCLGEFRGKKKEATKTPFGEET